MKQISIFMVFVLSILSFSLLAQNKIEVKSGTERFSVGHKDAIIVDVYEADVKFIKKAWKKLIKRYSGKVKMKSEIFADDVLIKHLSNNTFDIYTKIVEKGDKVEIICAVDLGGAFLTKTNHSDKFDAFEKILLDFAVEVSKEAVREQIDEQEKVFSKMEKEKEKLISDKERMEKEIETYKQKILDNEAAIEQNIKDQELKTKDIAAQKELIIQLSEKEQAIK